MGQLKRLLVIVLMLFTLSGCISHGRNGYKHYDGEYDDKHNYGYRYNRDYRYDLDYYRWENFGRDGADLGSSFR